MNKKYFQGKTVLVTGASSGIGEAFAHSLAARGANLVLTARSPDRLSRVANSIRQNYPVRVHGFSRDLALPGAAEALMEKVSANDLPVDILINNAGFGKWTHFLGESPATYDSMLSVNISAMMRLTHLCLPGMIENGAGGVINVASTAAFQPIPYQAVYAASKAFVLNFTEALAEEFGGQGIRFLALCPGNTSTNFMATANANARGMAFATAEDVATAGLNALARRKQCHVQGSMNYLNSLLPRVLPRSVVTAIVARMFRDRVPRWP